MARLPLPAPDDMTAEQKHQYERFPSNLTRALLLMDGRLARALPEAANALRAAGLAPALREAVVLRVAALSSSPYERFQHLGQAHAAGWTDTDVAAIEAGQSRHLPDDVGALLTFVDECVRGRVGDATFTRTRAVLSDRDLVTVIVLVGHYMTVARLTGVLELELDAAPDPWVGEH